MNKEIHRAAWHDYTSRCIYMVTMNKAPGIKDFGVLAGDVQIPRGQRCAPFVSTYHTGDVIKDTIRHFYEIEPAVRILQYAIMPDHLHLLLFVESATQTTLGQIIARFKVAVNQRLDSKHVFDKGFNDQILKPGRSLDVLFKYLKDNPRRLAARRANPDFFRRINELDIDGKPCQAYGNIQLLENPFKEQVVVHRADSPQLRERHRQEWLYAAANGGVLVSPFISAAEKAIRDEAEVLGGRFILLTAERFGERYKPTAHLFDLCNAGRLLIISAAPAFDASPGLCAQSSGQNLTRKQCMALNHLAATLTLDTERHRHGSAT